MMAGFSVLGSGNEVPIVVRAGCVDEAVGTIPSASGQLTQDVDAPRAQLGVKTNASAGTCGIVRRKSSLWQLRNT